MCCISIGKRHYVRAYCCYGFGYVKCYKLCCWYERDYEAGTAEKIGQFTYHGVITSKSE